MALDLILILIIYSYFKVNAMIPVREYSVQFELQLNIIFSEESTLWIVYSLWFYSIENMFMVSCFFAGY